LILNKNKKNLLTKWKHFVVQFVAQ